MTSTYSTVRAQLEERPRRWLVTGAAGFIGSNLVQTLLTLDQTVVGLDNFATGHRSNLDEVRRIVGDRRWSKFSFKEADIQNPVACREAAEGVNHVLHQAAIGSVPRSLDDPIRSNATNVDGFLNMMVGARDAGVDTFVYAASSSTYGDDPTLPKVENQIGRPLSPYAVTKLVNELYADVFRNCYGFSAIGLRYFNVFGPRQDPEGAYAAVVPKWAAAMVLNETIVINGDGETSRDFCFVDNAVQANLLAALADPDARGEVFNVAVSARTSLNELYLLLKNTLQQFQVHYAKPPVYGPVRPGDVRHSEADITKAQRLLGYSPTHTVEQGLQTAMPWYLDYIRSR